MAMSIPSVGHRLIATYSESFDLEVELGLRTRSQSPSQTSDVQSTSSESFPRLLCPLADRRRTGRLRSSGGQDVFQRFLEESSESDGERGVRRQQTQQRSSAHTDASASLGADNALLAFLEAANSDDEGVPLSSIG